MNTTSSGGYHRFCCIDSDPARMVVDTGWRRLIDVGRAVDLIIRTPPAERPAWLFFLYKNGKDNENDEFINCFQRAERSFKEEHSRRKYKKKFAAHRCPEDSESDAGCYSIFLIAE